MADGVPFHTEADALLLELEGLERSLQTEHTSGSTLSPKLKIIQKNLLTLKSINSQIRVAKALVRQFAAENLTLDDLFG